MKLKLLTPQKTAFEGKVESVTVPGTSGQFTVWKDHAPLISTLINGEVSFKAADGVEHKFKIDHGLAEVKDNEISIYVEKIFDPEIQ